VNHKKLLQVLRDKRAPERLISALTVMLHDKRFSQGSFFVRMLKGTPQGSPISRQFFALFIDPLIERLRACTGVPLTSDEFLQSLFFADDIVLLTESIDDLKAMLQVCEQWGNEYGITFSTTKSELMQLAGKITDPRPGVQLHGHALSWVTEFKYLGMMIYEGRRRKQQMPRKKVWQKANHVKHILSARSGLPLRQQLQVLEAEVFSAALYPAAVFDMDYKDVDTFVNKQLAHMTGVGSHYSATFLRCELGVLGAKYRAHARALGLLWRLEHQAWYKDKLGDLFGQGPYQRLKNIANLYDLDVSLIGTKSKESWKNLVKTAIRRAAEAHSTTEAARRHLPRPEPLLKPWPYIKLGSALAKYGVQHRWGLVANRPIHPPPLRANPLYVDA